MSRAFNVGVMTVVEWAFLLALWMAFVSQWKKDELLIGMLAAAVGTIADAVVKKEGFAKFAPKASWVALILWEPWYVSQGTWVAMKAFAIASIGKHPKSQFEASSYDAIDDDARSSAKRALAVAYLTIPPNSIVIGIDTKKRRVLMHELLPGPTSLMAKKLGVQA